MYQKTRVVICYVGETESLHRIVVAICEATWDAGAELRVRSVGEIGTSEESPNNTGRRELLRELETIPPATVEDLEWSDVALIGISVLEGEIPLALERLIDHVECRWRADRLADKVHYIWAPATIRCDVRAPIDADIAAAHALGRAAAEGTLTVASTSIYVYGERARYRHRTQVEREPARDCGRTRTSRPADPIARRTSSTPGPSMRSSSAT